ncbi:MAG: hypothetical protein HFG27_09700 [Provencibacterium sp.]|jgi:putative aldouronate transport system substrate-binding protein|nr:hypothetical protein [Provencibacterium sp.]
MKKSHRAISLAAVCALILCAGCVPQKASETPASSAAPDSSAASSAAGSAFAASGPSEPVTLSYWATWDGGSADVVSDYDEKLCYQVAQEATGIDIQWIHPPQGQDKEQFNLLVVSDSLPDIIEYSWETNYPGGAEGAISSNIIIPLNDYIETDMPNYAAYLKKFPEVERMVLTDTSKHYCIPYIYTATPLDSAQWQDINGRVPAYETYIGLTIRQDWIEDLGLAMPVTLEDWYVTLRAFKEQKGAEAPLSITLPFLNETQAFASAYGIATGFYEDNRVVKFGPYEAAYRDYLAYLNRLYSEGLLDADFAIIDNKAFSAKVLSDKAGAWSGYVSTHLGVFHDQLHESDPNTRFYPVGITNPVLNEGDTLRYKQSSYPFRNAGAALTTSNQKIADSLRFLDYAWSVEGNTVLNWGVEGDSYEMKDGWPVFTDRIAHNPDGLSPTSAFEKIRKQNGPFPMDHQTRLISKGSYTTPESLRALTTWETTNGTEPGGLPPVTILPEESTQYASLYSEISTYVDEMKVKFIMGAASLDEFDVFHENLKNMGMEEVLKIQQSALERYYNR